MPSCSVAPSSTSAATWAPMASSTGVGTDGAWVCSGRSVSTQASRRVTGTSVLPRVRGICSFTSAMMIRALSDAASAASTEVPSEQ